MTAPVEELREDGAERLRKHADPPDHHAPHAAARIELQLVGVLEVPPRGLPVPLDIRHGQACDEGGGLSGVLERAGQGGEGQHPEHGAVHPRAAQPDKRRCASRRARSPTV